MFEAPSGIERRTLDVGGSERSYWIATPTRASGLPQIAAPLLIALHGTGMTGGAMASFTGLHTRGPQAGFVTVFPDAPGRMWDDHGTGRIDGLDDAAFIAKLAESLVAQRLAQPEALFLTGISNGACFTEYLTRHAVIRPRAIALVVGTAREASRRAVPRPLQPTAVLCMYGTSDPMVPSGGGRSRGPLGLFARRRVRRVLRDPSLHESVAPDTLVADWLTANGIAGEPVREELGRTLSDPPVERLNWSADGALPVTMTRIVGGGHGWPGGPRYLPEWVIGKVPKYLDATGIVLDFFSARL